MERVGGKFGNDRSGSGTADPVRDTDKARTLALTDTELCSWTLVWSRIRPKPGTSTCTGDASIRMLVKIVPLSGQNRHIDILE